MNSEISIVKLHKMLLGDVQEILDDPWSMDDVFDGLYPVDTVLLNRSWWEMVAESLVREHGEEACDRFNEAFWQDECLKCRERLIDGTIPLPDWLFLRAGYIKANSPDSSFGRFATDIEIEDEIGLWVLEQLWEGDVSELQRLINLTKGKAQIKDRRCFENPSLRFDIAYSFVSFLLKKRRLPSVQELCDEADLGSGNTRQFGERQKIGLASLPS